MADYDEQQLASLWNTKFKEAMVHKAPYVRRWITYWDAYVGDYFKNVKIPEYKSNMISNYIFSTVETIRPIMLDNNPKFQSMPRQPDGMKFSTDLQESLMYEWDREGMNKKLYRELINVLVFGTSIFFIPWDSQTKNVRAIPVNIFKIFTDPLATTIEDAEYIIYADYFNVVPLRRKFPSKADKIHGGQVKYSEIVRYNNQNARLDNQVLVLEIHTKDYETEEKIDGNMKITKSKYPKGRVITICPELGIVLDDKENPYEDGEFPFELLKDYDVPDKFWGEGEVAQLLSPQIHINELNNAIIDSAKATANMPWIIDKNSGIPFGKITARPGLVIRKNPGSEVRREQPPQMPMYVTNAVDVYKTDIEEISGIYNTLKGENSTGVYTAQGILALQEAGQVRIRLKVKLLEDGLGRIGQKWYSRMKQYWKEDRWLLITKADGSYDMKMFVKNVLKYDYSIKIVAGSTMPSNRSAMLDFMIRLAQTPMPDGSNVVDREAIAEYLPEEVRSALLERMGKENQNLAQLQQGLEQISQQLQDFMKKDEQEDNSTLGTLEDMTSAIEDIKKQIIQLQGKHDKLEEEKMEEEKTRKIQDDAYNKGYGDAEKIHKQEPKDLKDEEGTEELPEEILSGIENLSDDELALLIQSNPELEDLLK